MRCTVYGDPRPKGSWRHVGGGRMVSAARGLGAWERAVRQAVEHHLEEPRNHGDPMSVVLVFRLPRPKSRRGEVWHATRPDIDKLCRAVLDALTGVVYDDDACVASLQAMSLYADATHPPGVTISTRVLREEPDDDSAAE